MAAIKKPVTKKPLVKKQPIGATKKKETPFQEGVRKKDFTASDTNYVSGYNKSTYSSAPMPANDKAPKTTKGRKNYNSKLDKAYTKTYGSSNITDVASSKRMSTGAWPTKESEYRVTPLAKKQAGGVMKDEIPGSKRTKQASYNPPLPSDTTGGKKSAATSIDKAYIEKQIGKKSDTLKKPASMKVDFNKMGYKKGGAVKKAVVKKKK